VLVEGALVCGAELVLPVELLVEGWVSVVELVVPAVLPAVEPVEGAVELVEPD
jgi:hypothetical protein